MRAWHEVGTLEQLERDGRLVARVGGRELGVLLGRDGSLHALRNRCPHHGAPLCLGELRELAGGTPGRYALTDETVLRCPWHGWEFDLETGRCVEEATLRVATYPVKIEAGQVLVEAS